MLVQTPSEKFRYDTANGDCLLFIGSKTMRGIMRKRYAEKRHGKSKVWDKGRYFIRLVTEVDVGKRCIIQFLFGQLP